LPPGCLGNAWVKEGLYERIFWSLNAFCGLQVRVGVEIGALALRHVSEFKYDFVSFLVSERESKARSKIKGYRKSLQKRVEPVTKASKNKGATRTHGQEIHDI